MTARPSPDGRSIGIKRYIPILAWLPPYDRSWLTFDVIAGLTLWGLLVPESMAYAGIAGLPPQAGLYTLLAALLVYALFGTSRHLSVGPTSATAALLASSAMNGGIYETTFNFFGKLKWEKTYDTMLATPLGPADVAAGELAWAVVRGAAYATAFLVLMLPLGLVSSWWALLVPLVAVLTVAAFGAVGLACTSFMRSWVDFEWVQLVLLPMFLFSTTFSPLSTYPTVLQWVVRCTPLYQSVTVVRGLCTGSVTWTMLLNVAYLLVMGVVAFSVASRRIARLLRR
jgi:lipooligosaccharide transport system permease protein